MLTVIPYFFPTGKDTAGEKEIKMSEKIRKVFGEADIFLC